MTSERGPSERSIALPRAGPMTGRPSALGAEEANRVPPRNSGTSPDYSAATEHWGMRMPARQLAMAHHRYLWAASHSAHADVLDIGCGVGFGIDLLSEVARSVTGGDITSGNLGEARLHMPTARLVRMSAQALPFADAVVDVVLLAETLYYLYDAGEAIAECRRVLRPRGKLLLSVVNPERPGHHATDLAVRYYSMPDLKVLIEPRGFSVKVYGAFPVYERHPAERLMDRIAQVGRVLHIRPKAPGMRLAVKRLMLGRLPALESIPSHACVETQVTALDSHEAARLFGVLYAVAVRR